MYHQQTTHAIKLTYYWLHLYTISYTEVVERFMNVFQLSRKKCNKIHSTVIPSTCPFSQSSYIVLIHKITWCAQSHLHHLHHLHLNCIQISSRSLPLTSTVPIFTLNWNLSLLLNTVLKTLPLDLSTLIQSSYSSISGWDYKNTQINLT